MLLETWNAATEEFSEDWPSTAVHQIQGARIIPSVSYDQKDWEAKERKREREKERKREREKEGKREREKERKREREK